MSIDPRFIVTREEFLDVQMDLKRVQSIQHQQSERLRLLEKRQADDAALRSVWNSPFPSALGGTPQHGPVHMPSNDVFDDLDEQSQTLLGSLHLGAAEDEPTRRGAASRANSVRFDESALQGSNWAGQGGRHSSEFGPIRPSSGLGGHPMMERSLSHKSDGRHSSAGHSVHSGVSGRASSLGLDTNFVIGGHEDESPLDIPEPPPGFYFLGSAPSIIRCWLNTNFTSSNVLYAAVCTGSQRTTVEYSLVKELELVNNIHRDVDGVYRITLPVFLAEASVMQSNSRSSSPVPQLPSITASFEVTGLDQPDAADAKKTIRIFIGSYTLRMHSADLLLSQNLMTLYGSDRDKLSVPFVRPEDDATFQFLTTTNVVPEKPKLNATAPEFVSTEQPRRTAVGEEISVASQTKTSENGSSGPLSPRSESSQPGKAGVASTGSESGNENEKPAAEAPSAPEPATRESAGQPEHTRRESSAAIRTPWRQSASANGAENGQRENAPLSGYQPATRTGRMKILKPSKPPTSSSARTGASYEPAPASRSSGEFRRKSGLGGALGEVSNTNGTVSGSSSGAIRWGESKRSFSTSNSVASLTSGTDSKSQAGSQDPARQNSAPRTANNPLGSASAFSWISKKTPAAAAE